MAYQFQTKPTASFQYSAIENDRALTISQINGRETNAQNMITGLAGLFWIVNEHTEWEAENGTRTLKQIVVDDDT